MSQPLSGQVAWITGAGSGIGRAGALALADAGATVVVSGRRRDALEETAAMVSERAGTCRIEVLDVSDAEAVAVVAAAVHGTAGRIDILVNSAGMNVPERHWDRVAAAQWDQVVRINLDGTFYCTQAVLPLMRAQGGGLMIHISSWAGRYDSYLTGPAYNAAKHAVVAMSASLNLEEGRHGIRSCTICPGEVATPILDKRPVPVSDQDKARMLQPEDLGATIRFVAELPPRACMNEILVSPTWNRITNSQIHE